MADDDFLPRRPDLLNSALVIVLIIAGGLCFLLASMRTTFSSWLTPTIGGSVLWMLALHFKKLGRLY